MDNNCYIPDLIHFFLMMKMVDETFGNDNT